MRLWWGGEHALDHLVTAAGYFLWGELVCVCHAPTVP
jgi:hypothetical protein